MWRVLARQPNSWMACCSGLCRWRACNLAMTSKGRTRPSWNEAARRLMSSQCRMIRSGRSVWRRTALSAPSSAPVVGLEGSGLDRLLHPPGNDEEPDAPRKDKDVAEESGNGVGCREPFGTEHPALHQVAEARQPHEVANHPRGPRRPHDHDRKQVQRQTKHEALVTSGPPLQPPNRFSAGKACGLRPRWCARPVIHRLLEGD